MIYLDSSVVLAHVFAEPRALPELAWREPLISSRLLEYEVWNCVYARGLARSHEAVRTLLRRIDFLELDRPCLARALEPFPVAVRTLNSFHLATIEYIRQLNMEVALASFDRRMIAAARALGVPLYDLRADWD